MGPITSISSRARGASRAAGARPGSFAPDEEASAPTAASPPAAIVARSIAAATVSWSQPERSMISAAESPPTMIPWFCMTVIAGAGPPVRST